MGQNSLQCLTESSTPKDLISRQVKMYKWRANPDNNYFLPRVTFKNALMHQQQQKHAMFLKQSQKTDFFQLYKLKEELAKVTNFQNEQVLVFEQYYGNLEQICDSLTVQEAAYCLKGLLLGFQQIKKMFTVIVVRADCCFVTKTGEIRAWINTNCKCNQIYSQYQRKLFQQKQYKPIIFEIMDIVFKASWKTAKVCDFFNAVRLNINEYVLKNDLFSYVVQMIEQYCNANSIRIGRYISNGLPNSQKLNLTKKSRSNSIQNIQAQQITLPPNIKFKINIQPKSTYVKSRSLQSQHLKESQVNTTKASFLNSNFINQDNSYFPQPSGFVANASIIPKESAFLNQFEQKYATTGRKSVKMSQILQKTQKPIMKKSLTKGSNSSRQPIMQNNSDLLKHKPSAVDSLKISISKQSINNQKQLNIKFQDLKMDLVEARPVRRQVNKFRERASKNQVQKKYKRPSIKEMVQQNQLKATEQFKKNQVKFKTCKQMKSAQSIESQKASRPWITTKTITKLITQKGEGDSLAHSEGTSSDQYAGSIYSGILTQIGRDITQRRISTVSITQG